MTNILYCCILGYKSCCCVA